MNNYIEEATDRYRRKLESGYYSNPRSTNTEVDYSSEKEERDVIAFEKFTRSKLFQELSERV